MDGKIEQSQSKFKFNTNKIFLSVIIVLLVYIAVSEKRVYFENGTITLFNTFYVDFGKLEKNN